jgi:hypothetical protein
MSLAGYWGPEAILYSTTGDPAKAALIEVREDIGEGMTGPLTTLYTDINRTGVAANPTKTDGLGNLSLYAEAGFYRVAVVGTSQTFLIEVRGEATGSGGGEGPGRYEHVQAVAQSVWTVNHGLGARPPAVSVFSLDFETQFDEFTVQHLDVNSLLISVDVPTAGRALM